MATVRGNVVLHSGLEKRPLDEPASHSAVGAASINSLLLRVQLRAGSSGVAVELQFRGRWALMLHTLQPQDALAVESATPPSAGADHWTVAGSRPVVRVMRGTHHMELTCVHVDTGNIPAWFRLPPARQISGVYHYIDYLSSMRSDVELNFFAVVWQNARPGAAHFGERIATNIIVIDKSYDSLPLTEMANSKDLPQYSLQVSLYGGLHVMADLPFLCVGDVVRVHRGKTVGRPPRFVNIYLQRYSSLVVFDIDANEGSENEFQATDRACYRAITSSAQTTMTHSDFQKVNELQHWARERLSRETMSGYLTLASDVEQGDKYRDLVVLVQDLLPDDRILIVSDGSTQEPVHIYAGEPESASAWLFQHVRPGMWLQLRAVHAGGAAPATDTMTMSGETGSGSEDEPVMLSVHAANVTRVPVWCFDARARRPSAQPMLSVPRVSMPGSVTSTVQDAQSRGSSSSRPSRPSGTTVATAIAAVAATSTDASAAAAPPWEREGGETAGSVRPPIAPDGHEAAAPAVHWQTPPQQQPIGLHQEPQPPLRADEGQVAASHFATTEGSAGTASEVATLSTPHAAVRPLSRIRDVKAAAARGVLCHVLSGFVVTGYSTLDGAASQVERLLHIRCRACKQAFPWTHAVEDPRALKKRRLEDLPCGHWLSTLQFSFAINLRDLHDPEATLSVHVEDANGEFFGISPEDVSADPLAFGNAQRFLDSLTAATGLESVPGHTLAVRLTEASCQGAYVVSDSRVHWLSAVPQR